MGIHTALWSHWPAKMSSATVWRVRLSDICGNIVPDTRSSFTEGSVAKKLVHVCLSRSCEKCCGMKSCPTDIFTTTSWNCVQENIDTDANQDVKKTQPPNPHLARGNDDHEVSPCDQQIEHRRREIKRNSSICNVKRHALRQELTRAKHNGHGVDPRVYNFA